MPFMTKVVNLFMSMDTLVGRDFEKGLIQPKAAAESAPQALPDPAPAAGK